MSKKRINLALLAGGKSGEREVSLMGAAGVEKALDPGKFTVTRYDPLTDLAKIAADAEAIDFAFILLHGLYGEDGTVQGLLDLLDIPYQGSGVTGSALAMDKNLAKVLYKLHGLPVAEWRVVENAADVSAEELADVLGLPLVVKPVCDGSSLGMTIVRNPDAIHNAIENALRFGGRAMIEKFISGREITVGVLGNSEPVALPLVEIIPGAEYEFFDYNAKYKPGATREVCPAEVDGALTREAQKYGVAAHKALQLRGYSRTDMIIAENGELFLLETNTIPGMTPTSLFPQAAAAHGLDFSAMLERLIELGMEKK
ncbi:MAG: D-alanine--D-alanine ligase [Desulfopila sp.]|jgi:D-alanine-D-alanine ligase|nr:D-alanine--D-alanine ligase [Desulfopila sp.]